MKQLKVLAVDDDMINRKLLKSMLTKQPFVSSVSEAKDGAEALSLLRDDPTYDIILLDIIMPVLNGIDTLKILQSDSALNTIPVIVLTTDETKKSDALDCGATDFLTKPIREQALIDKINAISL